MHRFGGDVSVRERYIISVVIYRDISFRWRYIGMHRFGGDVSVRERYIISVVVYRFGIVDE
jgi:hypothetical protein